MQDPQSDPKATAAVDRIVGAGAPAGGEGRGPEGQADGEGVMHDDDNETASPERDEWVGIAERLKREVTDRLALAGAMTLDELNTLTNTADNAMRFHVRALLWDKRLELEASRAVAPEYTP